MEKIIGLKQFREDVQKVAEAVARGKEYVVVKRSRPIFRIVPPNPAVRRPVDFAPWKKMAGIWKGIKMEDPIKWQKRTRAKSERKFDWPGRKI